MAGSAARASSCSKPPKKSPAPTAPRVVRRDQQRHQRVCLQRCQRQGPQGGVRKWPGCLLGDIAAQGHFGGGEGRVSRLWELCLGLEQFAVTLGVGTGANSRTAMASNGFALICCPQRMPISRKARGM